MNRDDAATADEARRIAQQFGVEAEAWVASHLARDGWDVLARNWRTEAGELDLVVERLGVLRFVEVKARAPGDSSAVEAVGDRKQRVLRRAAEAWLASRGLPEVEAAFLVAVVERVGSSFSVEWIDDAF